MTANRVPQIVELLRHRGRERRLGELVGARAVVRRCGFAVYAGVHLWAALIATFFAGFANLTIALLGVSGVTST